MDSESTLPASGNQAKWNPKEYSQLGAFVPQLGEPLIDLLDPQPGERVLDIGCGNGILTRKLVERGAQVTGVDASADMVAAARQNGIEADVADARTMTFPEPFDAAFSNAALHWMTQDPQGVLNQIAGVLKPGGRFVAEMGGEGNIGVIRHALQVALKPYGLDVHEIDPKFFPHVEQYRAMLTQAGFEVVSIKRFERPTPLPEGITGWLKVFATRTLAMVPEPDQPAFLAQVEDLCEPVLQNPNGSWFADYVRLRFVVRKKAGVNSLTA